MKADIRPVCREDIPALLDFYRIYVESTNISWELAPPSLAVFTARVEGIAAAYPFLVCTWEGRPVGYAYGGRFHEREAYRYDTAVSVYLHPDFHGRRIGTALYAALFDLLRAMGFYVAYAGVVTDNEKSMAMHTKCGFTQVGTYRRAGYKFGRWHDVTWMEKALADYTVPPGELKGPDELDRVLVREVCERAQRQIRG